MFTEHAHAPRRGTLPIFLPPSDHLHNCHRLSALWKHTSAESTTEPVSVSCQSNSYPTCVLSLSTCCSHPCSRFFSLTHLVDQDVPDSADEEAVAVLSLSGRSSLCLQESSEELCVRVQQVVQNRKNLRKTITRRDFNVCTLMIIFLMLLVLILRLMGLCPLANMLLISLLTLSRVSVSSWTSLWRPL